MRRTEMASAGDVSQALLGGRVICALRCSESLSSASEGSEGLAASGLIGVCSDQINLTSALAPPLTISPCRYSAYPFSQR